MSEATAQTTRTEPPAWLSDVLEEGAAGRFERGVLRFVEDESYASNFGREWNWFAQTQLDRPAEGATESHASFFEKTGWTAEQLDGRLVLDVGCGMGRFADVAASCGARVVALDLSAAVDAAAVNLSRHPDVAVIQADVFDLPLRAESFDLIYSIGVLHHTPDTRAAFERLPPLLRPGGEIAIWVYSREGWLPWHWFMSNQYRRLTSRMSHERLLRWCRRLEPLGRLYRTRFGKFAYPLLPVSVHPEKEWRVLDTFDWYSPRYQWKHKWDEVEGWFRGAGLSDVRRQPFEVAVSGRRPESSSA